MRRSAVTSCGCFRLRTMWTVSGSGCSSTRRELISLAAWSARISPLPDTSRARFPASMCVRIRWFSGLNRNRTPNEVGSSWRKKWLTRMVLTAYPNRLMYADSTASKCARSEPTGETTPSTSSVRSGFFATDSSTISETHRRCEWDRNPPTGPGVQLLSRRGALLAKSVLSIRGACGSRNFFVGVRPRVVGACPAWGHAMTVHADGDRWANQPSRESLGDATTGISMIPFGKLEAIQNG
jgi:hypothetical protein